ncbi:MAG: YigZ family protein [Lachnospiraceae bacterium]|nr:YigZ family protein [Lachnospiraceae bacterium]
METYRIIYSQKNQIQTYTGEIVEKKSRFIANIRTAESEEEAIAFVEQMRKRYYDARHNCYAFVVGPAGELVRSSDDGEPSGTAGRPMLEVLLGRELRNVAVVVTRYFGGVLLGTGGLVRAYTQAVQEALQSCPTAVMRPGKRLEIETDYNGIGKILYLLGKRNLTPESSEYTDRVCLRVLVPEEEADYFTKDVIEVTAGRSRIVELEEVFYPVPE